MTEEATGDRATGTRARRQGANADLVQGDQVQLEASVVTETGGIIKITEIETAIDTIAAMAGTHHQIGKLSWRIVRSFKDLVVFSIPIFTGILTAATGVIGVQVLGIKSLKLMPRVRVVLCIDLDIANRRTSRIHYCQTVHL